MVGVSQRGSYVAQLCRPVTEADDDVPLPGIKKSREVLPEQVVCVLTSQAMDGQSVLQFNERDADLGALGVQPPLKVLPSERPTGRKSSTTRLDRTASIRPRS